MKGKLTILFITICLIPLGLFSQRGNPDELKTKEDIEKTAEFYLQEGMFEKAMLLYKRLLLDDETNPKLNFLLGYSYLNTGYGLDKAIDYLKKSTELETNEELKAAPLEASYYLALAYHQNKDYKKAIALLDQLSESIPENNKLFKKQVVQLKEYCQNAIMLAQNEVKLIIENIFELNSKHSDKNPLVLKDGKEIIFTSRRETGLRGQKEDSNDDNIFSSKFIKDRWSPPVSLGNSVNTPDDESACWASANGDYLIITRREKNKSNLFYTERKGSDIWSIPVKFPSPINSKFNETFGSLSPDGKFLFFASDRRGGNGELDIYVSEKIAENNWSEPVNLGTNVNTELNETSPIMHENGVLFFSSQGHTTMGGFDIFTSFRDLDGKWETATNMGHPINTIKDDFYYQAVPHGQYALTSSDRRGTKGESDIFKYELNDTSGLGYALVTGKINTPRDIKPHETIEIVLRELGGSFQVKTYSTNKFGNFSIGLKAGSNYQISYSFKNQVFFDAQLKFPKSYSYLANDQSIRLKPVDLELYDNTDKVKPLTSGKLKVFASANKATETMKHGKELIAMEKALKDPKFVSELNKIDESLNTDTTKTNIVYSIRLAKSDFKQDLNSFTGLDDVKETKETDGTFTYTFGEYKYEWEAEIKLKLIKEEYPDARVIENRYMQ